MKEKNVKSSMKTKNTGSDKIVGNTSTRMRLTFGIFILLLMVGAFLLTSLVLQTLLTRKAPTDKEKGKA